MDGVKKRRSKKEKEELTEKIIKLKDEDGFTFEEIGEILYANPSTCKQYYYRYKDSIYEKEKPYIRLHGNFVWYNDNVYEILRGEKLRKELRKILNIV